VDGKKTKKQKTNKNICKTYTHPPPTGRRLRKYQAQLTPQLARDTAATWRLSLKLDTSVAIRGLTCAAPSESVRTTKIAHFLHPPLFDAATRGIPLEFLDETYRAKTKGMTLLYGENCLILTSTVFN